MAYKELNNPFRVSGPVIERDELLRRLNQLVSDIDDRFKAIDSATTAINAAARLTAIEARLFAAGIP